MMEKVPAFDQNMASLKEFLFSANSKPLADC
uniref:Uncharacterized protein n=1 Tax=Rhizophora mucronata TaxID=61149 RepID=A0A2P2QGS3_RHIMU